MALDLWQIRRRNKMTIDELANLAGIAPGLIKAYELGHRAIPEEDLEKLATALSVEAWEIKELSDPPPRGPSRVGEESPSRYSGGAGPARPDYDSGSTRYPGPPGSGSRYGDDTGPSRYNEGRPPRYGESGGPSRYGEGGGSSRYSNDQGYYRYNSERGSSGYGSQGGSPRYGGGDRYSRYDDTRPSQPRPSGPRPYDDRRMDRTRQPRKPARAPRRQPSSPARPSQLEHLKGLLIQLDMTGDELLRLAGKPLSMLTRKEAARLLTQCQAMLAERKPDIPKGKRQRPYLPESVDEHELVYLTEVQLSRQDLHLTLFNGQALEGRLLGFSPYALTLAMSDDREVTVQKLAVAYYEVQGEPIAERIRPAASRAVDAYEDEDEDEDEDGEPDEADEL